MAIVFPDKGWEVLSTPALLSTNMERLFGKNTAWDKLEEADKERGILYMTTYLSMYHDINKECKFILDSLAYALRDYDPNKKVEECCNSDIASLDVGGVKTSYHKKKSQKVRDGSYEALPLFVRQLMKPCYKKNGRVTLFCR